jgi:hypothetical protein
MVTLGEVWRFALTLQLTTEAFIGGQVKFRVGIYLRARSA